MLSPPSSDNSLEILVAEYKLLRVLTPELRRQIGLQRPYNHYVVEYDDQLYLSLEHISDNKQREYFYHLIQNHQLGLEVDLITLPAELQLILQPDMLPPPSFWGPLILGGVVGVVVGVLAMAMEMLLVNVTAVTLGDTNLEAFNLQLPTIIFVFFAAFGWIITATIAWRRLRKGSMD